MPKLPPAPLTPEDKLDQIVEILRQMNKRDRMRMWGSTIHSILGLIPLVVFLFSLWYVYNYGDQLLEQIAAEAAKQASNVATGNAQMFFDGFDSSSMSEWFKQVQGQQ
jgi:succinate dehydrogenase/fumarate reductase cytochrome b subunit